MKKCFLTVLLMGISVIVGAMGNCCDPCCQACSNGLGWDNLCCGEFEVFGYALYMRPSTCNDKFVIVDPTYFERSPPDELGGLLLAPVGKADGDCFDYEWGFRVGGGFVTGDGCSDFRVYYSRVCATDNGRTDLCDPGVLWPTVGPAIQFVWSDDFDNGQGPVLTNPSQAGVPEQFGTPAFATQHARFEWDAVDAEVASRRMHGCNLWLRTHIGLEWTELRHKQSNTFQGTTLINTNSETSGTSAFLDFDVKSRVWGVGPKLGFDARYDVFCGFGITARAGTAILAGEVFATDRSCLRLVTKTNENGESTETVTTPFDVVYGTSCFLFPELDAALGISYEWSCGDCFSILLEIGYEFRTYFYAIPRAFFIDERTALNASACDAFSLQGLYFGALIAF